MIRGKKAIAEFEPMNNMIGLFGDCIDEFCSIEKTDIETQIARTLSHEVFHALLLYIDGMTACVCLDLPFKDKRTLAIYLKEYGLW